MCGSSQFQAPITNFAVTKKFHIVLAKVDFINWQFIQILSFFYFGTYGYVLECVYIYIYMGKCDKSCSNDRQYLANIVLLQSWSAIRASRKSLVIIFFIIIGP